MYNNKGEDGNEAIKAKEITKYAIAIENEEEGTFAVVLPCFLNSPSFSGLLQASGGY
jgi:hypothetical protein